MPQIDDDTFDGNYEKNHKDGSLYARGTITEGDMDGYWEWFRLDGTIMRSGSFDRGVQVGEWTTYDAHGAPHKTTVMKPRT